MKKISSFFFFAILCQLPTILRLSLYYLLCLCSNLIWNSEGSRSSSRLSTPVEKEQKIWCRTVIGAWLVEGSLRCDLESSKLWLSTMSLIVFSFLIQGVSVSKVRSHCSIYEHHLVEVCESSREFQRMLLNDTDWDFVSLDSCTPTTFST